MKKVISVLLAAIMLISCFGMISFARSEKCTCPDGDHNEAGPCTCCRFCDKLDVSKRMACYHPDTDERCCDSCDGVYPCTCGVACGCNYCKEGNQDIADGGSNLGDYITEQDKQSFVDTFQSILKTISDFFDDLFDTIFEFLKIDQVLGKGDEVTEPAQ